ncbi:MAG: hypothetical protein CM1200mP29_16520 [Verrucomicrobiota bacterium]|nr:MAG: hypothetical protein CM1200mP29_16520 [Verrucomicrobiota bacterium]
MYSDDHDDYMTYPNWGVQTYGWAYTIPRVLYQKASRAFAQS